MTQYLVILTTMCIKSYYFNTKHVLKKTKDSIVLIKLTIYLVGAVFFRHFRLLDIVKKNLISVKFDTTDLTVY